MGTCVFKGGGGLKNPSEDAYVLNRWPLKGLNYFSTEGTVNQRIKKIYDDLKRTSDFFCIKKAPEITQRHRN